MIVHGVLINVLLIQEVFSDIFKWLSRFAHGNIVFSLYFEAWWSCAICDLDLNVTVFHFENTEMCSVVRLFCHFCMLSCNVLQLVGFSDEVLDLVMLGTGDSHLAVATNSTDIKLYRLKDMSCQLLQGHTDLVLTLAATTSNPLLLLSGAKVCHSISYFWRMFICCKIVTVCEFHEGDISDS
jgi:hypothetical protein